MATKSLLSHIAFRFPSQENLATESLVYIVRESPAAKRGLLSFVHHHLAMELPESVVFHSQESNSDRSIPDIIGYTLEGKKVIVIEAKFWAPLTAYQPVSYLQQLPLEESAVLLFVAPAKRLNILWDELLKRCTTANLYPEGEDKILVASDLRMRRIGNSHFMALTSWRALLAHIVHGLSAETDIAAHSDLHQLQGLCDRMDEEAFLPICSEELTSTLPTRFLQFVELIDEVGNALMGKLASPNGNWTWSGQTRWIPLKIHGFNCNLQMSPPHWKTFRSTPFWLSVTDSQGKVTQSVKDALMSLQHEEPDGVIYPPDNKAPALVPLVVPLGVERQTVLEELLKQIRTVADLLVKYSQCSDPGIPR